MCEMKKAIIRTLALGFLALPAFGMASMPGDSVGTKIVNGKAYILYKITKGDNLSQISRQYRVSVASLEEVNEIQGGNIQIGQILMVPSRTAAASLSLQDVAKTENPKPIAPPAPSSSSKNDSPKPQNPVANSGDRKQHIVAKGETLYAISRQYGVSVADIKSWNNLSSDALAEGQKLWIAQAASVEKPSTIVEKPIEKAVIDTPKVTEKPKEEVLVVKDEPVKDVIKSEKITSEPIPAPKIKENSGFHIVRSGETLFGIAKSYGMDVTELKKINRLENATIAEGQELRVKAEPAANSLQGISLSEMLEAASDTAETPKLEKFPDLAVLTAPTKTVISPKAKVEVYKDKSTGKDFKRVEETGIVGKIEDFSTDQTRFYAFHKNLPVGSYLRVDYPQKGQSILVEVISQLPEKDEHVVRLSAKCLDYLMIRDKDAEVRLRYAIPFGN